MVEVGYNAPNAVDAEHSLVVATNTINRNDKMHWYDISKEAKENIKAEGLKGYSGQRLSHRKGTASLKF